MANKCKRFVLFSCATYYPGGGFSDYHSSYNSLEEALAHCRRKDIPHDQYSFYEITDLDDLDWELPSDIYNEINEVVNVN